MKWLIFFIIKLLIFNTFLVPQSVRHGISPEENQLLRILFKQNGGENWFKKNFWSDTETGNENEWYGISCDKYNTKLIEIKLSDNNLTGKLPENSVLNQLNMPDFETLDLSNNKLKGNIPSWIARFKGLKRLNLSNNELSGRIPSWLGDMENLEELILSGNNFENSIPRELGKLLKLRVLKLDSNNLTGEIPASLLNLNQLEDNCSDLRWNGLYTKNNELIRFLNKKQFESEWENTQTVSPEDIQIVKLEDNIIEITWKPIKYISNNGGYKVFYSPTNSPNNEKKKEINSKTISRIRLDELTSRTKYIIKIQTYTKSHPNNRNKVESIISQCIVASTRGIIISGIVKNPNGKGEPEVILKALDSEEFAITNNNGEYKFNMPLGWSGNIKPFKEGFDFFPLNRDNYKNLQEDRYNEDYTASHNTIISGKVTFKGKGISEVKLIFKNNDSVESEVVTTDREGKYINVVPPKWSGTVTPEREYHLFEPSYEEYISVSSPHIKDYTIQLPFISGRVTDRNGNGIPGVELEFTNVDLNKYEYLSGKAITNNKGDFQNSMLLNWKGDIYPIYKGKHKYIFYPSSMKNKFIEINSRPFDFKIEPDFKVFITVTGNYLILFEEAFDKIYGRKMFTSEITAGYKFSIGLFFWGGYGFYSKKGTSLTLKEPSKWEQHYESLGIGFYKNLSLRFGYDLKFGLTFIHYSEKAFNDKYSASALGYRFDGSVIFKITDHLFSQILVSGLFSNDKIDDISINIGGIKTGIGLGVRF